MKENMLSHRRELLKTAAKVHKGIRCNNTDRVSGIIFFREFRGIISLHFEPSLLAQTQASIKELLQRAEVYDSKESVGALQELFQLAVIAAKSSGSAAGEFGSMVLRRLLSRISHIGYPTQHCLVLDIVLSLITCATEENALFNAQIVLEGDGKNVTSLLVLLDHADVNMSVKCLRVLSQLYCMNRRQLMGCIMGCPYGKYNAQLEYSTPYPALTSSVAHN